MTSSDDSSALRALEAVLDALPDAAMLIDLADGSIVAANELAATLLESTVQNLRASPANALRDRSDQEHFNQSLAQLDRSPPPMLTLEETLRVGASATPLVTSHLRAFRCGEQRFALHVIHRNTGGGGAFISLRDAAEHFALPLMVFEPERADTVYMNAACASLCGLTSAGRYPVAADRRRWRLYALDGSELAAGDLPHAHAFRGEAYGPRDLLLVPTGSTEARTVSVVSAPIRRDGDVVAAVATMVDMGNVRALERELRSKREAAENEARRKGAFYASLSRELRNPLTSILGYLDLIADPESPERERQTWYTHVRRGGEALMALVQDLVDLGQMEAGAFTLQRSDFSTSLALAQVLSQARAKAQQHDRDVVARYTTPVPRTLTWDAVRFRQCLSTIIHFAIDNTTRGDVTLQAAVIGENEARALAFDVSAHCPDLTQDDIDTLFDPFRPSTPRARPWSLAFPVARRLAEAMGGTVECGIDGDSLWFRMTITPTSANLAKMARLSPTDDNEAPSSVNPPMRLRGTVLLVEDSEADRLLVTKMLERSGLRVDWASCGADALERKAHRYDAILMDVELPGMDGLETTKRLRADGVTVPIVALTASVLSGDRERCLDAGCTAYVTKPIDRPMLLRTLDGLISTTEDRRVLSMLPPELAEVEPLTSTRDNDPTIQAILPQFVARMSRFVDHISRAIPDREFSAAVKASRSLGATADNCGFPPLATAAAALADACSRDGASSDEIDRKLERVQNVAKRIQAAYPDSARVH